MYKVPKIRVFILTFWLLIPGTAFSQGIEIKSLESTEVGGIYLLDAQIEYLFSEEVLEALEHGVALRIDIIIRIKKTRKWLWDKEIREEIVNYRLERHPLSNHYLVRNLNTGNRYQLQSLSNALAILGTISNHKLIDASELKENSTYTGHIMAKLNIESLPPPLRPVAYASEQWKLESKWQEWVLK